MLDIRGLNYKYDDKPILNNINLSVKAGEVVLLRGQNGSGKTTLLKCIAGIINGGRKVFIDQLELKEHREKIREISYMMSEDTLYDYLTVEENIHLFFELFDESQPFLAEVDALLSELSLEEFRHRLVKQLSKGTRQKIYLIIMLARQASIYLLDEPFSALDSESQEKLSKKLTTLAASGAIVLYSSHIAEFSSIATRDYLLKVKEEV